MKPNRNKVRLTESQLHKVIKESVKRVLKELDLSTMPLGGDAYKRNDWWKGQVDTDFPNHGIKDSSSWQDEYYRLQGDKDAEVKKQAKLDKQAQMKELKARAKEILNGFKSSMENKNMGGEPGFLAILDDGNKCYIYGAGSFNFTINGQNYDDDILLDWAEIKNSGDDNEIIAYYVAKGLNTYSSRLMDFNERYGHKMPQLGSQIQPRLRK